MRAFARPHMAALADQANGAVYLGVRDGLDMVLVETASPRAALLLARLRVGSRFPMVSSALGRAYLSAVSDIRERERLESQLRDGAGADEWRRLKAGYTRARDDADVHGYCMSLGEFHRDIHSVAVPLVVAVRAAKSSPSIVAARRSCFPKRIFGRTSRQCCRWRPQGRSPGKWGLLPTPGHASSAA